MTNISEGILSSVILDLFFQVKNSVLSRDIKPKYDSFTLNQATKKKRHLLRRGSWFRNKGLHQIWLCLFLPHGLETVLNALKARFLSIDDCPYAIGS
jgi:hypothetical protein